MHYQQSGSNWDLTKDSLLAVMGKKKNDTVRRWISLVKDLPPGVRTWLQGHPTFSYYTVVDNKYMVGGQSELSKFRLTEEWAIVALGWRIFYY